MEAGKERLSRDTVRDATRQEIVELRRENGELKQLVGELSLQVSRLKKNGHPDAGRRRRYCRMSALKKATILASVATSPLAKRRMLRDLGVPKSTYYRWLRLQQHHQGLEDRPGVSTPPWNRLRSQEERSILEAAREMPELSSRQLAAWDHGQPGLRCIRVHCVSHPAQGGSGEVTRDAVEGLSRVPPQDHWPSPDVGYRCLLLQGHRMGLLLPGHCDGRLFPLHTLLEAAAGHDYRLSHRGGPGGCRQDWHDRGPGGRPDQLALGQRLRICVPWLQRLPAPGGNQAHPGCTLPPSDQRQAGALSPDYQERRQAGPLQDGFPIWRLPLPPSWRTTTTGAITRRWAM